ncbi:MAG: hypothetical protein KOO61_01970 [Spirochaetales bacterium]|nr:hypothetical protein [Spirochaetales bacterium]
MRIDANTNAARRGSILALTVAVIAFAPASCGGRSPASDLPPPIVEENEPAAAQLPEIATIGGVQDVWPFSFGLDADRELVRSIFGPPAAQESQPVGGNDSTADIVSWDYPGFSFTFFVDDAAPTEQLLSARISSSAVELRGGLAIDMKTEEALAILGEPGFRSDDRAVFFYYATTIELDIRDDRISEIALSRAMP